MIARFAIIYFRCGYTIPPRKKENEMNIKVFPKGARVVFAGDSITNGNKYLCHIAEYYKSNLPELGVQFFNCGISGCSLGTLIAVFDRDIMYYEPTHIVLTIGVNDSGIGYLKDKNEDTYKNLAANYERYKANLEKFAELCKKNNVILSLGTTFPYAEYQPGGSMLYPGGYALVKHYADTVRAFAEKNGYEYCDYHPYLTRELMFKELYRDDHVHPNPLGHYYIAKCFLESQGFTLESDALSPEITEWNAKTQAVRNVFVAMYELTGLSITVEEAKAKVEAFLETNEKSEKPNVYRGNLARNFLRDYEKFDENRAWLKAFKAK